MELDIVHLQKIVLSDDDEIIESKNGHFKEIPDKRKRRHKN
jgi:hypothetical protein